MPTPAIGELAAALRTTPEQLRGVVQQALGRLERRRYYVYRITASSPASTQAPGQPRTIAAFPTPDDALAFAQRNGYGSKAQLRAVGAAELIVRMLSDPGIGTLLFAAPSPAEPERGWGPGTRITRDELLAELQAAPEQTGAPDESAPPPPATEELTAERYDALQFGVNFTRRAEFRVALAQAVEQVVDSYQPPEGGVEAGPRSIFATAAVESWLKQNGFPHAFQRRWIDVAGDPAWSGAVELCEIDGGTENRLLVQLAIHEDESGRQFIKRVLVTP